jgi:prepilin-type processing-associated H-X9-DG protein
MYFSSMPDISCSLEKRKYRIAMQGAVQYKTGMNCEPRLVRWLGVVSNRSRNYPARSLAGFGLLEVLFVVAIILLVFVLYWGSNTGNKAKEKRMLCRQNLERMSISLEIYANEHNGVYPQKTGAQTSAEALDSLVPKYTVDTSLFICPGSEDQELPSGESIAKRRISYSYYMGRKPGDAGEALMSDHQIDTAGKAPGQQVFSTTGKPPGNNHKTGGNILFCDGHVASCPQMSTFSLATNPAVMLLNP